VGTVVPLLASVSVFIFWNNKKIKKRLKKSEKKCIIKI